MSSLTFSHLEIYSNIGIVCVCVARCSQRFCFVHQHTKRYAAKTTTTMNFLVEWTSVAVAMAIVSKWKYTHTHTHIMRTQCLLNTIKIIPASHKMLFTFKSLLRSHSNTWIAAVYANGVRVFFANKQKNKRPNIIFEGISVFFSPFIRPVCLFSTLTVVVVVVLMQLLRQSFLIFFIMMCYLPLKTIAAWA